MGLRQNSHYYANNIFKFVFLYGNCSILIEIFLRFVPEGPINKRPVLVQIMAWYRFGTNHNLNQWWSYIVTRPHWIKTLKELSFSCMFRCQNICPLKVYFIHVWQLCGWVKKSLVWIFQVMCGVEWSSNRSLQMTRPTYYMQCTQFQQLA